MLVFAVLVGLVYMKMRTFIVVENYVQNVDNRCYDRGEITSWGSKSVDNSGFSQGWRDRRRPERGSARRVLLGEITARLLHL